MCGPSPPSFAFSLCVLIPSYFYLVGRGSLAIQITGLSLSIDSPCAFVLSLLCFSSAPSLSSLLAVSDYIHHNSAH